MSRQRERRDLHADPDVVKHVAELSDGVGWELADYLAEMFPADKYGGEGSTANTGLYAELREIELTLARDYGIIVAAEVLRNQRATAIAWPRASREARTSFDVHKRMRGPDRFAEMQKRLRQAEREGSALTSRQLARFRADEKPVKPPLPLELKLRRRINAAVRAILAEGVILEGRADWWNVRVCTDARRAAAISELRRLADQIAGQIPADGVHVDDVDGEGA